MLYNIIIPCHPQSHSDFCKAGLWQEISKLYWLETSMKFQIIQGDIGRENTSESYKQHTLGNVSENAQAPWMHTPLKGKKKMETQRDLAYRKLLLWEYSPGILYALKSLVKPQNTIDLNLLPFILGLVVSSELLHHKNTFCLKLNILAIYICIYKSEI